MTSGGGTLFLGTQGNIIGPGHISIFTDEGADWFGYHYYDGADNGASKYNLRRIFWQETGWPSLSPPVPSPSRRLQQRRHGGRCRLRRLARTLGSKPISARTQRKPARRRQRLPRWRRKLRQNDYREQAAQRAGALVPEPVSAS